MLDCSSRLFSALALFFVALCIDPNSIRAADTDPSALKIGVMLQNLDDDMRGALSLPPTTVGAIVSQIAANGLAAHSDLATGDIITAINGVLTDSAERAASEIQAALLIRLGPIQLLVLRNGAARSINIALDNAAPVVALSQAATPGKRTYLALRADCSIGSPIAQLTKAQELFLYPFRGEQKARSYRVCPDGSSTWGQSGWPPPGCRSYDLASYAVTCRGGTVSGPAFYSAFPEQSRPRELTFTGANLAVGMRPAVVVIPDVFKNGIENGMREATRTYDLPAGYAPLPPSSYFETLAWDELNDVPLMPLSAPPSLPDSFSVEPPPVWVSLLATGWVLLPLLALIVAFTTIAMFGFFSGHDGQRWPLFVLAALAAFGGIAAAGAANIPQAELAAANQQLAQARREAGAVVRDRTDLWNLTHDADGLTPLSPATLKRIKALTQPRTVHAPHPPASDPAFWAMFYLAPLLSLLLLYAHRFAAGYYHLFMRPPIEAVLKPAFLSGGKIDIKAAAGALRPDLVEAIRPPPVYQSASHTVRMDDLARAAEQQAADFSARTQHSTSRLASLLSKLRSKTHLQEAIKRRERARRDYEDAKRQLEEAERRLKDSQA